MNVEQDIHTLTRLLNLRDARQDWGITNSDPSRVDEFIRFCETAELTSAQQFAMGELVFASANDALAEGIANDHLADTFERFLASGLQCLPWHIRYWSSLGNEEEFPIATLLHRLTIHA